MVSGVTDDTVALGIVVLVVVVENVFEDEMAVGTELVIVVIGCIGMLARVGMVVTVTEEVSFVNGWEEEVASVAGV